MKESCHVCIGGDCKAYFRHLVTIWYRKKKAKIKKARRPHVVILAEKREKALIRQAKKEFRLQRQLDKEARKALKLRSKVFHPLNREIVHV